MSMYGRDPCACLHVRVHYVDWEILLLGKMSRYLDYRKGENGIGNEETVCC